MTQLALDQLRAMDQFQWYVIFMFVVVLYIYFSEAKKKNFNAIFSALILYTIHWFVEIINALIQHFTGDALWAVPAGSAFVLLVGVGIELSFMFSIAGIVQTKLLPDDPKKKILGLPAPLAIGLGNAALASILEIFLSRTNVFFWAYWPWWSTWTVFLTVYIPFFVVSAYAYYWKRKSQLWFLIIGAIVNISMLIAFILIPWLITGKAMI
ncbi:MAG: hypothetical protein JW776_13495 [Candidatus Lokiarchaeota archaeon]|nr:hypothetical protein [Candidatus Lokiarchaeota archaeon]